MKIIENFLSPTSFSNLKNEIFKLEFPWYYIKSSAYYESDVDLEQSSFVHLVFHEENEFSYLSNILKHVLYSVVDKNNEKLEKILRIRIGLIPYNGKQITHSPHVDYKIEHKTALFYLNTCDGDTILYKERYPINQPLEIDDYYKTVLKEKLNIEHRITPKENSFVIFDGLQYHSSSTPKNYDKRVVVNFNYTTKNDGENNE